MKVAYNDCYGGFSLSPLALTKYAKKKGIDLTWYERFNDKKGDVFYKRLNRTPANDSLKFHSLNFDFGKTIKELPSDSYYYPSFVSDESRKDVDLINVIESLGVSANGLGSSLRITEVPDGVEYEIDEYDGNESVLPIIMDESVSAKELDELREKAEAFDFLSGMGEFQFMPSPEYCSLFNDEESSVTEGDNLLDCVKQARECEG